MGISPQYSLPDFLETGFLTELNLDPADSDSLVSVSRITLISASPMLGLMLCTAKILLAPSHPSHELGHWTE